MPVQSREWYLLPQPDPDVISPVGTFLAALGNPGWEGAAGQEGTCAGVLRDGLAPAGQSCSSDLHRAVIHTALCLSEGFSHSDLGFGFFLFPQVTAQFWEKVRGICRSLLQLLPLCTHTCGVTECPTHSLGPQVLCEMSYPDLISHLLFPSLFLGRITPLWIQCSLPLTQPSQTSSKWWRNTFPTRLLMT